MDVVDITDDGRSDHPSGDDKDENGDGDGDGDHGIDDKVKEEDKKEKYSSSPLEIFKNSIFIYFMLFY